MVEKFVEGAVYFVNECEMGRCFSFGYHSGYCVKAIEINEAVIALVGGQIVLS